MEQTIIPPKPLEEGNKRPTQSLTATGLNARRFAAALTTFSHLIATEEELDDRITIMILDNSENFLITLAQELKHGLRNA